jgi:hypothetical protein
VTESTNPHRIDPPSPPTSGPVGQRRRNPGILATVDTSPSRQSATAKTTGSVSANPGSKDLVSGECREAWLEFQAADLISRLQTWSDELDTREARLNVQASLQDSRERQFRLRQQDAIRDLTEQQRSMERLRSEIESQVRRLAFRDN